MANHNTQKQSVECNCIRRLLVLNLNALYQKSNAESTKMAKIDVYNIQLSGCFKTFLVFPEHCAFC